MDFEDFVRKTDEIRHLSRETTDEETKKRLKNEFFDVVIDYYNEHLTGDFIHADGSVTFIGAIEPEPRTKYTPYNETPTKGTIMSKTSVTPENSTAPQTSKIAEKLNSLKPSNLADEKKETVVRRIKLTAAFAAGILTTVTAVAVFATKINATDEVREDDESSETEIND